METIHTQQQVTLLDSTPLHITGASITTALHLAVVGIVGIVESIIHEPLQANIVDHLHSLENLITEPDSDDHIAHQQESFREAIVDKM